MKEVASQLECETSQLLKHSLLFVDDLLSVFITW